MMMMTSRMGRTLALQVTFSYCHERKIYEWQAAWKRFYNTFAHLVQVVRLYVKKGLSLRANKGHLYVFDMDHFCWTELRVLERGQPWSDAENYYSGVYADLTRSKLL